MSQAPEPTAPARRPLFRPLLGLLLLLGLGFSTLTFLDAMAFIGQPFANFGYTDGRFVNPVLFGAGGTTRSAVNLWDRVLAVDGAPVERGEDITRLLSSRAPGQQVRFTVEDLEGRQHDVAVTLTAFTPVDFLRWHTSQTAMALAILLIGLLVWWLRDGPRAQGFGLMCLTTALMLSAGVDGTLFHRFPSLFHFTAPFVPAAGMYFASTLSPRLARRRTGRLVWGIPLLLGIAMGVALGVVSNGPGPAYAGLGVGVYALLLLGAVAFFVVMLDAWLRPEDPLERSRAGVILLTWPLGMGIPALNFLLGFTLPDFELTAAPNAAILLMPTGVALGIFQSRLFDADLRLRRILADLLVTGAFTTAYALALGGAYLVFPQLASSPAVAVALAALLLGVAAPLRDGVKKRVDGLLEGRRYNPQEALARLAGVLTAELSLDRALQRVQETLGATVQPRASTVLLLGEDGSATVHALLGPALPVLPSSTWEHAWLVLSARPSAVRAAQQEGQDQRDVRVMALPPGVALVVPLRGGGRELGALLLGPTGLRRSYSAADLVFLRALAGQAAPTLATARAFAEVDRLNRTLEERVEQRTAELTLVNRELLELDRRKDELISTISHDFRSPLAIIRSHVETVLQDPQMDAPTRTSFLSVVERQARRLTGMAENLLNLARLRDGRLSLAEVGVGELLRSAADSARPRVEGAGVSLVVEAPEGVVRVSADGEALGRALHNLLDNAARFTPRGGRVQLFGRVVGSDVELGVADTGIGIPLEDQPRICEPFYQVKRAGAEREGSGLGLAIVKEVVERHGSHLVLESSPAGTTWTFRLPRVEGTP